MYNGRLEEEALDPLKSSWPGRHSMYHHFQIQGLQSLHILLSEWGSMTCYQSVQNVDEKFSTPQKVKKKTDAYSKKFRQNRESISIFALMTGWPEIVGL